MFEFFQSNPVSRFPVALGFLPIITGIIRPLLQNIGFGWLPGDIAVELRGFRFYFPIAAPVLISLVLTLIPWLVGR